MSNPDPTQPPARHGQPSGLDSLSLDALPVPAALSRQGAYLRANEAFLAMFGLGSEAELLGRPLVNLIAPAEREAIHRINQEREHTGVGPVDYETLGLRRDGQTFPMHVRVSRIPLEGGEATLACITDISGRKEAEDRLRRSEETFRTYIEQSLDVIFTVDTEGRFLFVSPAWEQHFGFPGSEVLGKPFTPFIHPDDVEPCLHYLGRVLASGQSETSPQYRVRHADGSWRWFVANGSVIEAPDGGRQFLGIGRDISQVYAAEEALREAVRFNEQIILGASEGIIVYGADLRYRVWNPFMERLSGLSASQVLGRQPLELFPFLKEANVIQRLERVLAGEIVAPVEFPFLVPGSGKRGWCLDTTAPLLDTRGEIIGVIATVTDITERKRSEESLVQERQNAERYLEVAQVILVAFDAEARITLLNPKGCEVLGYKPGELTGQDWFSICLPHEEQAAVRAVYERILDGDLAPVKYFENHIVRKDGARRLIAWNNAMIRDEEGRIIGTLSSGEDITDRRAAEEDLARANVLLEQSQILTKMGAWSLDVRSGQLIWTPETYRLHDVDPGGYVPTMDSALAFYEPESQPLIVRAVEEALANGKGYNLELRLRTAKGKVLWIRTIGTAVFEEGRCIRLLGTIQNITQRKEAEAALRDYEEQTRVIFEASEAGIILVSPTGHITFANQRMAELFGMPLPELIGTTYPDHLHPSEKKTGDERMRMIISGEIMSVSVERKFLRADGAFFWGHLSGRRIENPDGSLRSLLGIITDVTERRQAEDLLRLSEDRLRLTLAASRIGSWDWDLKLDTWFASPYYYEMLGYAPESRGSDRTTWFERVHPEDRDHVRAKIQAVLSGEATEYFYEARMRHADGSHRWIQTVGFVVESDQFGNPSRMVGIRKDVTDLKQAEEESAHLMSQLHQAQKMESLGALAGGVAHDMNNVLGAILGLASAHIETQPAGSPVQKALGTIIKAAERGGNMLKSLLNFSRQSSADERDLDLNAILREEVRLLERTTLAKVRLVMELDPSLRLIRADAGALTHALMNLCVNAVDAMPENGTLTLRTLNRGREWVEVQVQDTGIGMPKEVLEKALDPFFTTKEVGKGTGLGLSIVYSTVKAHRGEMTLQSEPGRGTCVTLRFPACAGPVAPLEPSGAYQTMPWLGTLSVLLVDDDELIQSSMLGMLEQMGHRANLARSGEEALAQLEEGLRPDVVILDMNMPGLGGAGTLPRLRALQPRLPVLLATGRADQAAQDLIRAHPFVTLLPKPFGMKELQAQLDPYVR